jgi:hypothetical protein
MANVGALGSTSQIAEISGTGKETMGTALDMGKQMGLDKAKRLDREAANERARLSRAARQQYQTQKDKDQYIGTRPERDAISDALGTLHTVDMVSDNFVPEYGSVGGTGFAARLRERGYTYEPNITDNVMGFLRKIPGSENLIGEEKQIPNVRIGPNGEKIPLSEEEIAAEMEQFNLDRQGWWREYELLYSLPERNRLFGATLTPNEQASWEGANINSGMKPEQIERHLATLKRIHKDVTRRMLDERKAMGWSTDLMNQYESSWNEYTGQGQPASTTEEVTTETVVPPPTAPGGTAPEGVEQSEWDSLTEDERAYYLENMERFK